MNISAKNKRNIIIVAILILIPLGIYFFKKTSKESNVDIVKNAVTDVGKQYLSTCNDFIPDIAQQHFLDSLVKENLFTAKTKFDLINNNNDSDYEAEISAIRNSETRQEDIKIGLVKDSKDFFDLNWIYGGDYSYIYSPGIYTKYIKINPHHLGKEYLESNLKKDTVNAKKMSKLNIDPFAYPDDLNDVEKLYKSYFDEYYSELLKEDNIKKTEDKDRDYYQIIVPNDTFKEILLTHTYFVESLYFKYKENIFSDIDPTSKTSDEYFSKLRDDIVKKYNNDNDNFILTFTIKGKNLSSMDIFKNEKEKKNELLRIGFYGEKNITDIVKITHVGNVIYHHKLEKDNFDKELKLKNNTLNLRSNYNKDSKTLNSSFTSNNINTDIDLTFNNTNNKGFETTINMLNYKDEKNSFSLNGSLDVTYGADDIEIPEISTEVFHLTKEESKDFKEKFDKYSQGYYFPLEDFFRNKYFY